MGFYLRKAFSFGPVRLNLSRSGLGMSVGVTGARLGVGPRGSYVHLGRGGVYYRQTLGGRGGTQRRQPTPVVEPSLSAVDSKPASEMVDSSAPRLLEELNRVQARIPMTLFATVGTLALIVAAIFAGLRLEDADRSRFRRAAVSPNPADARSSAEVLRDRYTATATRLEQLTAHHEAMVKLRWYVLLGATVSVGLATLLYARHLDVTHGTAVLTYDLDTASEAWFSRLLAAFKEFASCDRVWHIREKGSIEDWKRNAGATSRLSRRAIVPALSLPRRVRCNLEVPSLEAGSQTLYLFPDRMLVYEGSSVGAVPYSQLTTSVPDSLFHEDETVPSDSKRVGTTWQYVNKDGGPDRRFNNNTQIPVMRYGNIHFTSSTGSNELFQCSRPEAGRRLTAALRVSPAGS
jgi:hypothetical protein